MIDLSKTFMFAINQPLAGDPCHAQPCAEPRDGEARQKEAHEIRMECESP